MPPLEDRLKTTPATAMTQEELAERAAVKEKIEELNKSDTELAALKPKLDATMAGFKIPTAVKYQQLAANVMLESFRKINPDEASRQKMDAFVTQWRARTGQD